MSSSIDTESFGFLIGDLSRLIRSEFDRRIGEAGLGITAGEARMLAHVARTGPSRQTAVAERMGVEAMTVTGFLDRLEGQGLVERATDPSDRRAKIVSLTARAAEVLAGIRSVADSIRSDAAADMDDAEWARLRELVIRARENLSARRTSTCGGTRGSQPS